jgi:6-phosphogluconolactonase
VGTAHIDTAPAVVRAADAPAAARAAAAHVADRAREAVADRGRFLLAVSGGRTPLAMLEALVSLDVPWDRVRVFQVDERAAPDGDPDRNIGQVERTLIASALLAPERVHAMPVTAIDLEAAAREYAGVLGAEAGDPPVLDLVHLGLGTDGHTASLIPGDPAERRADAPVLVTGAYQGRRRMTLSAPVLDAARARLWLVTGADKTEALARLLAGDASIPAGRVRHADSLIFADGPACAGLEEFKTC